MKRLVLKHNYAVEFNMFKNIFSDPGTVFSNNKTVSFQELSSALFNSLFTDYLIALRLQNHEKKSKKLNNF